MASVTPPAKKMQPAMNYAEFRDSFVAVYTQAGARRAFARERMWRIPAMVMLALNASD